MQPRSAPRVSDLALAVLLGGAAVAEVWVPLPSAMGDGARVESTEVALVACAALAFRRTHPVGAAAVAILVWPVAHALLPVLVLFWGQFVPLVVALFSVARHASGRGRVTGCLMGAASLLYVDLRVPELGGASEIVFHWMVSVIAVALGVAMSAHERRAQLAAARASSAEASSREHALQAVADERARIARELHDIVAHSVSVIVVQAGAAEKALDDPEFVRQALASIRTTGAGALTQMRRVVDLIRDEDEAAVLDPQPGVDDLERLVTQMHVPTRLHIEGEPRPLEPGMELAAYRIVQEALTNIRRHSHARSVEVTLRHLPERLEIEVVDDGAGVAATGAGVAADAGSRGHGLIGMRERARMYGGTVAAAPVPGEGFRVHAVLPLAVDR